MQRRSEFEQQLEAHFHISKAPRTSARLQIPCPVAIPEAWVPDFFVGLIAPIVKVPHDLDDPEGGTISESD